MKAVVRRRYGDTSVLQLEDVDEPAVEPGWLIVDVAAAGVNMAEWHMMSGEPVVMRLATGLRAPKRPLLGQDVAGVVAATGPGVTRFAVGDAVFGSARGSWATRATAHEDLLQPLPKGVSFEQAAAVPMSGYTALQALRAAGDVAGKRIAITGAAGGVGSYAVQLASSRGAHVTAVCSGSKAGFVRDLGADDVIDYTNEDPTAAQRSFDAVLDFAGSLPLSRWKRAIRHGGTLVLGGGEEGGTILGPLSRSIRAPFTRGITVVTLMASANGDDLAELAAGLGSGTLRSTHTRSYGFSDAAQAVDALRAAAHPGKIVMTP
ncbi:MAG TPA: NAD(P)-dependent alcohol dehydrogenase [Pseudolysinimonas sp.]|jgi:NADPH:quinone reductase-like Zn-dependent oxidoreductase|nr:NAD(P)-dependent alcohol dehydrogenase [Pseudolysinimonas sp.]